MKGASSEIKMTVSETTSGEGMWKLVLQEDSLLSLFDLHHSISHHTQDRSATHADRDQQLGPILEWLIRQVKMDEQQGRVYLSGLNYEFIAASRPGTSGQAAAATSRPMRPLHEAQQHPLRTHAGVDPSPFTDGIMGVLKDMRQHRNTSYIKGFEQVCRFTHLCH
jgi:hypothetical protein